jgi:hypothetical protein
MIEKAQGTYSSGTVQDFHLIPYYGFTGKPDGAPLPDKDISISFAFAMWRYEFILILIYETNITLHAPFTEI